MVSRIFWIEGQRLALMARPLGGDRLDDEIAVLNAQGVDAVLSLLERDEVSELDLSREGVVCAAHGIAFHGYPIPDRGLPADRAAFLDTMRALAGYVAGGGTLAIHCRAGIGRTSLAAAAILVKGGIPAMQALALIGAARGLTVPDTDEQRAWIAALDA
jgi:protein-tyrosine phosphatase